MAAALDGGDPCRAAADADRLRGEAIQAVNSGQIPPRYQEDLLTSANELATSTAEECSAQAPPPTTETDETATETAEPEEDDDERDDGRGKGKGKGKGKDKDRDGEGGDDELLPPVSLTVPTMPADVQGRRSEKIERKRLRKGTG